MTRTLVLASASPARLALLRAAGFAPEVIVSGVREPPQEGTDAWSYVRGLAELKARTVAARLDGDVLVLGCDSMLEIDGQLLGKPASAKEAAQRWHLMRGRSGRLLTGHCVLNTTSGGEVADVAATVVHFGEPTDTEIAACVATGEPLQVAGAFTLDGRSAPYIRGIEGDHGNVIGLSLPLLRTLLGRLGVQIHELWA